jgi:hypothetical protein
MQQNMWDVERRSRQKQRNGQRKSSTVILPIMLIQAPSRLSRFFTTFILCLLGYIMFFGTVNAATFETEVLPHNFFKGLREGLEEEDKPQQDIERVLNEKWNDIVKTCKDFHRIHGFFENQVCNNMAVGAKVIQKDCEVNAKIEESKSESMTLPKSKESGESGESGGSGESGDSGDSEDEFLYKTTPKSTLYYEVLGGCEDDVGECLSKTSTLPCCKIDKDQKKIQKKIKKGINHLNRDNTLELLKKVKTDFAAVKKETEVAAETSPVRLTTMFEVVDQNLDTIKSRMRKADAIKTDMEEKNKEAADSMREDMDKIKKDLKDSKIGDKYSNEASRELDSVKIEEAPPLSYEVRSECEKEL